MSINHQLPDREGRSCLCSQVPQSDHPTMAELGKVKLKRGTVSVYTKRRRVWKPLMLGSVVPYYSIRSKAGMSSYGLLHYSPTTKACLSPRSCARVSRLLENHTSNSHCSLGDKEQKSDPVCTPHQAHPWRPCPTQHREEDSLKAGLTEQLFFAD